MIFIPNATITYSNMNLQLFRTIFIKIVLLGVYLPAFAQQEVQESLAMDYAVLSIGRAVETLSRVCPKRFPSSSRDWEEGASKWKTENQSTLNRLETIGAELELKAKNHIIATTSRVDQEKYIEKILLLKRSQTAASDSIVNRLAESHDKQASELCAYWLFSTMGKSNIAELLVAAEKLLSAEGK